MTINWIRKPEKNSLNVIFIHGFNSDKNCWRHENNSYWPELLKDTTSDIGICVFTYRTNFNTGFYSQSDIVDSLKEYFNIEKLFGSEEVIFVCHSMGGIVARRFLVNQQGTLMKKGPRRIGLFLVASPSLGSKFANTLYFISSAISHTQAQILRSSQDNLWLNDLDKDFINLRDSINLQIQGKELIEELPLFGKGIFKNQVVEPFSAARYFSDSFKVPCSDHITIAKPPDGDAIQHKLLISFIEDFSSRESTLELKPKDDSYKLSKDQPSTLPEEFYSSFLLDASLWLAYQSTSLTTKAVLLNRAHQILSRSLDKLSELEPRLLGKRVYFQSTNSLFNRINWSYPATTMDSCIPDEIEYVKGTIDSYQDLLDHFRSEQRVACYAREQQAYEGNLSSDDGIYYRTLCLMISRVRGYYDEFLEDLQGDSQQYVRYIKSEAGRKQRYKEFGFDSYDDFDEYVSPSVNSINKESLPDDTLLLYQDLLNEQELDASEILARGFSYWDYVEVLNALVTSRWAEVDETYTKLSLTDKGKRLLKQKLD
jgi:pimeloyl-ACP methyl ester carboxylesterase